jgi:lipopolysaccharide biosynthesis regulator YciM
VAIHERGQTSPAELAASLHHLGQSYAAAGQYDRAEQALRRALQTAEQKLAAGDPLIASARRSYEQVQRLARSPRAQPAPAPVPAAPAPE